MIPLMAAMVPSLMGAAGGMMKSDKQKKEGKPGMMDMMKDPVKAYMNQKAAQRAASNAKIDDNFNRENKRTAQMQKTQSETAKLMNSLKTFT